MWHQREPPRPLPFQYKEMNIRKEGLTRHMCPHVDVRPQCLQVKGSESQNVSKEGEKCSWTAQMSQNLLLSLTWLEFKAHITAVQTVSPWNAFVSFPEGNRIPSIPASIRPSQSAAENANPACQAHTSGLPRIRKKTGISNRGNAWHITRTKGAILDTRSKKWNISS